MMYSDGHSRLCGNVLYQPLDSSFRWAATGILPSRRIQDILSINDEGVSFRLYIIPACLPQTDSCHFLHTQSTCGLTHSEFKRATFLLACVLTRRHIG